MIVMEIEEQLQSLKETFFTVDQQFKSTASALPDPVFIIDKNGRYLDVIGGQERSLYHSPDFLIGKDLYSVLPLDLANIFLETISDSIETDSLKVLEYQLGPEDVRGTTADGPDGKQWFEGRVYPIKDQADDISSVVWMAINITRRKNLEKRLKILSEKDPLTGAFNRRYFMQVLEQSYSISKRYKNPLSVLVIDIDNFKSINDTFGHEAGDSVLKGLVDFCQVSFRDADLFARLGGEEFAILFSGLDEDQLYNKLDDFRRDIAVSQTPYEHDQISFTVSLGVIFNSVDPLAAQMNAADEALYLAKENGRNQISIYGVEEH